MIIHGFSVEWASLYEMKSVIVWNSGVLLHCLVSGPGPTAGETQQPTVTCSTGQLMYQNMLR